VIPDVSAMMGGGIITVEDTEIRFSSAAFEGGLPDVAVADVMSIAVEAVGPDTPVAEVVERLVVRDYTALPVVDADRRVIGMVSDGDLLASGLTRLSVAQHRAIGPELVREFLAAPQKDGGLVRQAMRSPAVTVRPEMRLLAAAHPMHERGLERLPVVDGDGRLCGVVGRLDVLRSIATGYGSRTAPHATPLPQEHRTVAEIMDRAVHTVAPAATLHDVLETLLAAEVKRVLVTISSCRFAGIPYPSPRPARGATAGSSARSSSRSRRSCGSGAAFSAVPRPSAGSGPAAASFVRRGRASPRRRSTIPILRAGRSPR
jgi:CBS-domain-containing membrane protein